jgi:hypothetical protein
MSEPSIYQQLVAAGVEIDHHESDLYCPVNEVTKAIVEEGQYRSGDYGDYLLKRAVSTFNSQIDGTLWYDIPFAYDPFWEKKEGKKERV